MDSDDTTAPLVLETWAWGCASWAGSASQLASVRGQLGLPVERALHFRAESA
ncbi:hypothetical protein [Variovorax sp. ZT4R33]|uniref:hypothetical protein n=1 Tax=Variovorax sp. ZT4R33 TaxID=3443743 RepID=UPI003F44FD3B